MASKQDADQKVKASGKRLIKSFEDLDVYRKAYALALEIHRITLGFPKMEQHALADQMRRASKGICANIAEGFAKQRSSLPEFKRYLGMAIGSSDEMKVWLSFSQDLNYLPKKQGDRFKAEYVVVAKMLTGLSARWQ